MQQRAETPTATLLRLLYEAFLQTEWQLAAPGHGQQKECYIAHSQAQTVFIKFDSAPLAILRRLGDLAVAPRVLAGGDLDGRRYVIQEYLEGQHPWGWRWFPENLPLLAGTTRRYHADPILRQLLAAQAPPLEYYEQIAAELDRLEQQLNGLAIDGALATDLAAALAELRKQAQQLQAVALAPIHGDPNGLNFILVREQLFLIDWDEIALADPIREIGQWLCWYVAQEQWPVFFARYGCTLDQALVDRLFWWSARASLANAVWHLGRQYPHEVFVRDCWDALRRQIAPHQVFAGT